MSRPSPEQPRVDLAWPDERLTSRLHVRVSPEFKEQLGEAARREGSSVSDFVTGVLRERVEEVLGRRWVVPEDYFDDLVRALDDPPQPLPWVADAVRRRDEVLSDLRLRDVVR